MAQKMDRPGSERALVHREVDIVFSASCEDEFDVLQVGLEVRAVDKPVVQIDDHEREAFSEDPSHRELEDTRGVRDAHRETAELPEAAEVFIHCEESRLRSNRDLVVARFEVKLGIVAGVREIFENVLKVRERLL